MIFNSSLPDEEIDLGKFYFGFISQDKLKHGYGLYISTKKKMTIEGTFRNGEPHGYVHIKWTEMGAKFLKYQGTMVNGKKEGSGTLDMQKKSKYIGEFKNDIFHGFGTLIGRDY